MPNRLDQILALLKNSGPRLHRLLVRLTLSEHAAEDLLQDVFVKLLQLGDFEKVENPESYARVVAINAAFDWRRRQSRHHTQPLIENLAAPGSPVFEDIEQSERLTNALAALQELPTSYHEVLVLRYLENETYESIAETVGKNPHQIRSLCHKGITRLRKELTSNRSADDRRA